VTSRAAVNLQQQSQSSFIFTEEFSITTTHTAGTYKMDPRYRESLILLLPALQTCSQNFIYISLLQDLLNADMKIWSVCIQKSEN